MVRIFNTLNVYKEMRVKDVDNNYGTFCEIFFEKLTRFKIKYHSPKASKY